jgi:hypothetical protein
MMRRNKKQEIKNPYLAPFNSRILQLLKREPKSFAEAERISVEIDKISKKLLKKYSKLMRYIEWQK